MNRLRDFMRLFRIYRQCHNVRPSVMTGVD